MNQQAIDILDEMIKELDFDFDSEAEYLLGKLEINYRDTSKKKMPKHIQENLILLLAEFIKVCSQKN